MAFTALVAAEMRRYAIEQARASSESLAEALDHHATRALDGVGIALRLVASRLEQTGITAGNPVVIHELLKELAREAPQVRNLIVLDSDGVAIHDSAAIPNRPLSAADRPWFTSHRESRDTRMVVGPPVRSRLDGNWMVGVSRRVNGPDGSFAGVVVASLDLGYFRAIYRNLRPGSQGAITLFTEDGKLIVREPFAEGEVGKDFAGTPLFTTHLPMAARGSLTDISPVDGIRRILSYRRLDQAPLVLAVSTGQDDVLRLWHDEILKIGIAGATLLGIILLMGWAIVGEVRRRAAAERLTRHALRRLKGQHAILQTILTAFPDGVQLLDPELKPIGYNERLFELLGPDHPAIAKSPDPEKALGPVVAGSPATEDASAPTQFREQIQNGRWVECRGTPVDGRAYLRVFRDVTEEVKREAELREANDRLERQAVELVAAARKLDNMRVTAEQAFDEADRANRAKSAFLASMSHELRTPLNAINGFSEIIADQHFGPNAMERYREYARDIQASGQHLLGLINSVLDLAKIEAGRMELREQVFDLSSCLQDAAKMVQPAAAANRQELRVQGPVEPLQIFADEQKLLQSFLNILSNAVKFTPAGGIISVEVSRPGAELAVVFRDNGVGMSPADLARIFTPFAQIDSVMTRSAQGTGLGMSVTRSLVELHGGRIEVDSEVGRGTVVTISLPPSRVLPLPLRAVG